MRKWLITVAFGVGVFLVGGALAAIPGADGRIHACYTKSGDTRIVDEAAPCRSRENRITWNQSGPAGGSSEFAQVTGAGTLVSGTATSATRTQEGVYELVFAADVSRCAGAASPATFLGSDSRLNIVHAPLGIGYAGGSPSPHVVSVELYDVNGSLTDSSFTLMLACP